MVAGKEELMSQANEIDTELIRREYTPNQKVQSDLCDEIERLRAQLAE